MKINMNSISRTVRMAGLKLKKHSPAILVTAGVAGTVTSTVMACKATTKAGAIVDDFRTDMDKIHEACELAKTNDVEYTEKDIKRDTTIVYAQTAVKFVKLYAPSVILGVASISCILTSHRILSKRNAGLAAAYAAVDKGFKEYRERVVERFGKDMDRELRHNIKTKEVEVETIDEKTGEVKTEKKIVSVADPNAYSDYAKIYDDGCLGWSKDPELNLMFLKQQQNYANEKLKSQGYLFLNEVYKMIGFPATKAGQCVGWIYDEKHPVGDNFVDFGIFDIYNERARDFVNGYERCIVLDFNVDGNILDMI